MEAIANPTRVPQVGAVAGSVAAQTKQHGAVSSVAIPKKSPFFGNRVSVSSVSAGTSSARKSLKVTATVADGIPAAETASVTIDIDNSEPQWTVVKLSALNQPGLLNRVTSVFRDLNVQVVRALVGTADDAVLDTFYVQNAAGNKIEDPSELDILKKALEVLAVPVASPPAVRPSAVQVGSPVVDLRKRLKDVYLSNDVLSIQESIVNHVEYTLARDRHHFDSYECYQAVAHSVRDRLIESWNDTNEHFRAADPKRVYYLSMEFLMGRSLLNSLYNLNLHDVYAQALSQLGYKLEDIVEQERDAALGNGGLGRLAACFLDSIATLDLPGWGYGIRYQYGMFRQTLENGFQHEQPDYWLTFGNPWEIERTNISYTVKFYGHVEQYTDSRGYQRFNWVPGEQVQAVAYDNPVPGYGTNNTINLRLWAGKPSTEFDLQSFNTGDYVAAILSKQRAESISSVLYPDDRKPQGKELRLKQQFFMVSASLQDIIRRFKRTETDFTKLPEKAAMQLNDTHPTISVAELMRLLMDEEGLGWTLSWQITQKVFAFTNHTVLPEALEKWPVSLMESLLPRHMQIIYQINFEFMQMVKSRFGDDFSRSSRMSIIEEGDVKNVRMANLAIVASESVNGVAAIHSELIKQTIFKEFYELWPHKFQNKTNGVTQRRWLAFCNPGLRDLADEVVGSDDWVSDLEKITALRGKAEDATFQKRWREVKQQNKQKLADVILKLTGVKVSTEALFDIQVKRIHEYKRQLLNVLSVIHRYEEIKRMSSEDKCRVVPRVVLLGGKAAPGYEMAKRIIKLISAVGEKVNNDPAVGDLLKLVFLPDYNVSLAEIIIPASDLSQHISTAGTEASGTSNMKFAMNGGLIIGTMDGANVEIAEEIGEENMFIFGVREHEVSRLRRERPGYNPDGRFTNAVNMIRNGQFGWVDYFAPLVQSLDGSMGGDFYLLANDFPSYLQAQAKVDETWRNKGQWEKMSILSTAGMSKFSSDRTIAEYAKDIWHVQACKLDVEAAAAAKEAKNKSAN
ncbi:unnamed protein product [Closterium sp. NIES-53]